MSIDLLVGEYCYDCPDFEVEQDTSQYTNSLGNEILGASHYLTCKNANKCKSMLRYIERKLGVSPNDKRISY